MRSLAGSEERYARAAARQLAGRDIERCDALLRSGNNRIYHVRTANAQYALKVYAHGPTGLARLDREYEALRFLDGTGAAGYVARPIAVDRAGGFALYEWIAGTPLAAYGEDDVDAALDFLRRLHGSRLDHGALRLPEAMEACVSGAALLRHVCGRIERLREATAAEPGAATFVVEQLAPAFASLEDACRRAARADGIALEAELAIESRTLSPSDFSFHNALRRTDGSLAFLDFEYFGWDDPVKLVADFLWHPAMALSADQAARFTRGAQALYGAQDAAYASRLRAFFPLFGLKWCTIVLNEFLSDDWNRRQFAGQQRKRERVKAEQLRKSRGLCDEVLARTREVVLW
ncbi:MAG: aminoglycoside phosphotransferase family protein [Candidatus Velthaea sp.]|jgi:hypothetical protein